MRLYRPLIILSHCLLLSLSPGYAQLSNLGTNQFSISDGLLSYDQFAGIFGQTTNAQGIISFPSKMTGAAFVNYRHFFSKKLALGASFGLDNQTGDLSYGSERNAIWYPVYNGDSKSGYYTRRVYTGAIELLLAYRTQRSLKTYGYIGAGYTSTKITFNFFDNIPKQIFFYGNAPYSMFPHNHTTVDFSHFNFQVTPIGISGGKDLCGFFELGFGYKGLIVGGISYKFNSGKHKEPRRDLGDLNEIQLLPYDYPTDNSLQYVATIKAHAPSGSVRSTFSSRLDALLSRVPDERGNVFRITKARSFHLDRYEQLEGKVYYTANFDSFKKSVDDEKRSRFENGKCAYIVIYRPEHHYGHSIRRNSNIKINDSLALQLNYNSRYIIKVKKEGTYKVAVEDGDEMISLNIQFGNDYYIRTHAESVRLFTKHKQPTHIFPIDHLQGDLESSLISDVHRLDLDRQ